MPIDDEKYGELFADFQAVTGVLFGCTQHSYFIFIDAMIDPINDSKHLLYNLRTNESTLTNNIEEHINKLISERKKQN